MACVERLGHPAGPTLKLLDGLPGLLGSRDSAASGLRIGDQLIQADQPWWPIAAAGRRFLRRQTTLQVAGCVRPWVVSGLLDILAGWCILYSLGFAGRPSMGDLGILIDRVCQYGCRITRQWVAGLQVSFELDGHASAETIHQQLIEGQPRPGSDYK